MACMSGVVQKVPDPENPATLMDESGVKAPTRLPSRRVEVSERLRMPSDVVETLAVLIGP